MKVLIPGYGSSLKNAQVTNGSEPLPLPRPTNMLHPAPDPIFSHTGLWPLPNAFSSPLGVPTSLLGHLPILSP